MSALGSLALIGAAACGALAAPEWHGSPALTTSRVWANVIHRNRGLSSCESAISMRFRESSFPFLGATLGGTAYFESGGRFVVRFSRVPRILQKFPAAYDYMMNIGKWPQRFVITSGPPRAAGGHTDLALHLASRDPDSSLQYGQVYVNPATWTIEEMDWRLKGMEFDVTQTF
ncbi:MAG: hypothetical protein ACREM6_01200, partial [Vulcanimicrobiaceae bacterium]